MSTVAATPSGLSAQNPWPGLRAFTEGDREFFFGRERETAELLGIVKRASVVVLYGQSGLGKTSLLQAGLFPQLKRMDFLPVRLRLDHSEEAPPLAEQIKAALTTALDCAEINAPRPQPQETLWEYFHRRDLDFWGARNRLITPVIVLDQFEEVFTLGQRTARSAARVTQFAADLESVIEHRPPAAVRERLEQHLDDALIFDFQRQAVKFMLSLREDFLPQLDPWRTRMPSLLPHRLRLERMTGAQALAVVERGGRELVAPNVAQDIVDFVSRSQRKQEQRVMEQRDVEPALLSVVCDELNRRRLERHREQITADLLTEEREGIIQSFYDRSFDDVDPRVRDWVEDELLTAGGHRDRAAMEDALRLGLPESAFDTLVDRRVLHREERAGVVWLELTHDLLSDPASRSRADREQRLQAMALARREEELSKQLWRSRRLTMIFGVLLLGTVAALIAVFVAHKQVRRQQQATQAALTEAQQQKVKADIAAASAQTSFQTAVASTDKLGLDLMDYVRGDMLVPTATVLKIIDMADQSYKSLHQVETAGQSSSNIDIALRHARFLTKASAALHSVGYFDKAREQAQRALELLSTIGSGSQQNEMLQLTQAEALFCRGRESLSLGDFSGARQDFAQVQGMMTPAADTDLSPDRRRLLILSNIGLGEADVATIQYSKATGHFQQALKLIQSGGLNSKESTVWRVRALEGLGLSQTEDTEGERWMQEADKALAVTPQLPADNPLRERLTAELDYQRGFIAYRLNRMDEAENFFEQSSRASEELNKRDADNLDWRLSLLQSWRGLGEIHLQRGEWAQAQEILDRADKAARSLNDSEPAWIQARFLLGAELLSEGQLIENLYWETGAEYRDPKDLDRALQKYIEAQHWLQKGEQHSAKATVQVAVSLFDQGYIYSAQSEISGLSKQAKEEKQKKALDLYAQARAALHPIEGAERPSAASYYEASAKVLSAQEKNAPAIEFASRAVALRKQEAEDHPRPRNFNGLSYSHELLGHMYMDAKQPTKAWEQYKLAAQASDQAVKGMPDETSYLEQQADVQASIFDMRVAQKDFAGAVDALDGAFTTIWSGLQRDYTNDTLNDALKRYGKVASPLKEKIKAAAKAESGSKPALSQQQADAYIQRIDSILKQHDSLLLLDSNMQHVWTMPPLLPGAWRTLGGKELDEAAARVLEAPDKPAFAAGGFTREQIRGIRMLGVDFYEDSTLYEAEIRQKNGDLGIVSYIQRGNRPYVFLVGYPDPIYRMNREMPPRLDTTERASNYLRFFVGSFQAEDGRFLPVDKESDINWKPGLSAEERAQISSKIKPLVVERRPNGGWEAIGTIQYGSALDNGSLQLSRGMGNFKLVHDQTISDSASVDEGFLEGVRQPYRKEMGIEYLSRRIAANPKDEEDMKKLVSFYSGMKRWDDAINTQQKLVALNPKDNLKGLVTVYTEADIPEMAIATQKKLIALDPDDFDNQWHLIVLYSNQKKWQDGLTLAQQLLTSHPKDRGVLRALAYFYSKLGRNDDSLATYKRVLELYPKEASSYRDLAIEYTARKQWDEAIAMQLQVVALDPKDIENLSTLANIYSQAQRPDKAVATQQKVVESNPSDTAAQWRLVQLYIENNQATEAVALAETVVASHPGDADSYRNLAVAYSEEKQWAKALRAQEKNVEILRDSYKDEKDQRTGLANAYLSLSWYQLMARDFSGALASSEAGRKVDDTNLPLETNHAHALLFLGHTKEADDLYLGYLGRKIGDKTWQQVILEDFDALEKEKVPPPAAAQEMARLRTKLQAK